MCNLKRKRIPGNWYQEIGETEHRSNKTERKYVTSKETRNVYPCMSSGIRDETTGFGVFHAVFKSCYSPVFPPYDPIASF